MSIENIQQFYQVVLQDSALQQQFQSAPDEQSLVNLAVELGQKQGYSFTSEEVSQVLALAVPSTETTGMVELADEQLEAVAGGGKVTEKVGEVAGTVVGAIGGVVSAGVESFKGNPDATDETLKGASTGGRIGKSVGDSIGRIFTGGVGF